MNQMWETLTDMEVRAAAVALGCNAGAVTTKDDAITALGAAGITEDQAKGALVRMANSLSALQPGFIPGVMAAGPQNDDDGPKRNVSAYCWFVQRNRDRIQSSGESGEKFMTRAVRLWKEQTEEERAQYETMANEDKLRYKRERRQHKIAMRKAEQAEDGPAKRRRKHPDAPKRAVPAYMLYANAERENLKAEMPHLSHREILGELGARWRKLDEASKAPYEASAAQERARYQEEIAKWREEHPEPKDAEKAAERRRRRKKEVGAPKRAQTAFLFYANAVRDQFRADMPEKTHKEILSVLGERWKSLPEVEKAPYLAKAEADRARYHAEMVEWRVNHPKQTNTQPQQNAGMVSAAQMAANAAMLFPHTLTSQNPMGAVAMALMSGQGGLVMPKRRGRKKKEPGAPKKCSTAFLFYANEQRPVLKQTHSQIRHPDLLKLLGEQWRQMTDEEKEPYEKTARTDRERYDREMEEWRAQKANEAVANPVQASLGAGFGLDPQAAAAAYSAQNFGLQNIAGMSYLASMPNNIADITSTIAGSLSQSINQNQLAMSFTNEDSSV